MHCEPVPVISIVCIVSTLRRKEFTRIIPADNCIQNILRCRLVFFRELHFARGPDVVERDGEVSRVEGNILVDLVQWELDVILDGFTTLVFPCALDGGWADRE